ncbi:hypothetical protein [Chitinophaga pinensis]|uniref:Uncharacterized protein n=1 Tax=Chitinophaga pinensis (strain ATCC 43595 / DSM 2588 / LMG 13176 / NBRC 15968 / NCIMB 11800 / UQM 2034) TaxID=485918 RepID=A0A979G6G6_CHIPD|nr:hypothetical protein [Chitinophaga pinensis]ACU61600.1 conserved hypothetical protein [Chitinophaga pinensis DSM 2588]
MRSIIVPKDREADILLDTDEATPEQLIIISFDNAEFKELWDAGIFHLINEMTNSLIDVYEDDAIREKYKLQLVLDSKIFDIPVATDKLKQIKNLFQEALQRDTGVYFYF